MRKHIITSAVVALGLVAAAPATASADEAAPTLADVLLSDSDKDRANGFDRRSWDYDIVTQALLLTDGEGALVFPELVAAASDPGASLTAFLPTDQAFRRLVRDLTGRWIRSEAKVFEAVAGLGVDNVGAVLSYHIVPGAKIDYAGALQSDNASLPTVLGDDAEITVDVKRFFGVKYIELIDLDTDDRNPIVVRPNVGGEAANGFAHGINQVLRPLDVETLLP